MIVNRCHLRRCHCIGGRFLSRRLQPLGTQLWFGSLWTGRIVIECDNKTTIGFHVFFEFGFFDTFVEGCVISGRFGW